MKRVFAGSALAMAVTLGMVAFAQTTGQPPVQPQTPTTAQPAMQQEHKAPAEQVRIVGCVQREADYRAARNLGAGGAAGTGAGVGDEFVLINASRLDAGATATGTAGTTPPPTMPPTTTPPPTTPPATTPPPARTTPPAAGATAEGDAFELTGDKEDGLAAFVGKRVEITGTMKAAEKGPAGATGGKTAGAPPTGIDVASADLRLREIEIISVTSATGTCPTSAK